MLAAAAAAAAAAGPQNKAASVYAWEEGRTAAAAAQLNDGDMKGNARMELEEKCKGSREKGRV